MLVSYFYLWGYVITFRCVEGKKRLRIISLGLIYYVYNNLINKDWVELVVDFGISLLILLGIFKLGYI